MLISLSDTDLRDQCQADGDDIAFYDGLNLLDYEIEEFNYSTGKLIAWVRIPSLSTSTNTIIGMYYGSPSLGSSEANPASVWNSNYKGVWHLSEDPLGTIFDSMVNNNDGFSYGAMTSGDQIPGKCDGCLDFDGSDDGINIPSLTDSDFSGIYELTLSAWINPRQTKWQSIISNTISGYSMFALRTSYTDNNEILFGLETSTGWNEISSNTNALGLNEWSHVVGVYNSTQMIVYVDGVQVNSRSKTGDITRDGDSFSVKIGSEGDGNGNHFNGIIDEPRISNIVRSASWIATEYNNQNNPNSFYTVGSEMLNDKVPPTVSITDPSPGSTVSGTVTVTATTSDNVGVTTVEFYIDDVLKYTDTSSVYEYYWDTTKHTNGSYEIKVIAYDAAGNTNTETISVNLANAASTNLPSSPPDFPIIVILVIALFGGLLMMSVLGQTKPFMRKRNQKRNW